MRIKTLFFGATADDTGARVFELDVPDGASTARALGLVIGRFPKLAERKLLFAVNEEYVDGETMLADGDELAVFTAVSGG